MKMIGRCWCFRNLDTERSEMKAIDEGPNPNQLMRDLENDFYVSELSGSRADESQYDFASGLLKSWWRKYYA